VREFQKSAGVPPNLSYDVTMYILSSFLVLGFICNLLIKPLDKKWFMSEAEVIALQKGASAAAAAQHGGSYGIGKGGFDLSAALAWAAVGIPIAYGVWITMNSAFVLFK
jgi:hypothetical protein